MGAGIRALIMVTYNEIDEMLKPMGFCLRGGFVDKRTTILVGNVGSDIWKLFGEQYDDWVEPDPLDEWTRTHLLDLAEALDCKVVFPFDGPPFAPFQKWAMKADSVFPTPLGPLIHPVYGVWHAYRGALVFEQEVSGIPARANLKSPCEICEKKPCLKVCPVQAFDGETYAVNKCMDYLATNLECACMNEGCLARHACPVGQKFAYHRQHANFHMDRFLRTKV
jgi:hypothetical protein